MALTPRQQASLDSYNARKAAGFGVPEPQRIRSMAQGLTFGGADELEAKIRAFAGEDEQAALADIRSKMRDYKTSDPVGSAAYEFAGAAIPSIAYTAATKQVPPTSAAATATLFSKFFPNVAKVAGIGAAEGGVTTALSSDKTLGEQMNVQGLMDIGIGATIGSVAGSGVYTGGLGAAKGAQFTTDLLSTISGSRARNAAANEIQRIAKEAGISVNDAMDKLSRGEILAEDPNIMMIVRSLRARGGAAGREVNTGMTGRPAQTQQAAMDVIESGIAAGLPKNLVSYARMSDDALAKLETREYRAAFAGAGDAGPAVTDEMYSVMRRYPAGAKKLASAFTSETGRTPFFSIDPETNAIKFNAQPTMQDAELLRRIVDAEGDALIAKGGADATIGINIKRASTALRDSIDTNSTPIATARANAANRRLISSSFQDGRKAMAKSSDDVEVEFNDILNRSPEAAESYRLGYLANMRSRMSTGAGASMMGRLENEASKEGMTLRLLFPGNRLDEALEKIGVAAQSRRATGRITGGSDTAATTIQSQRMGMLPESITTGRLAADALRGNVDAAANVLNRIIKQFQPGLSDAQAAQVARVLVSQDKGIVRKALTDTAALSSLRDKITVISNPIVRTAAQAAAVPATTEEPRN